MNVSDRLDPRLMRAVALSAAAAAFAYLGFSMWAGWGDVTAAFAAVGWSGLAIALLLSLANYGLRFARWQFYLEALGHAVPRAPSSTIWFSGLALTTTPGKTGELVRGLFLRGRGVPFVRSTAAFLFERLSDLVAVVLLTLPGVAMWAHGRVVVAVALLAIALLAVTIARADVLALRVAPWRDHGPRLVRLATRLVDLFVEARACHTPALMARATVLSFVAWAAEAVAFHVVLTRMGLDLGLGWAMFVYALAMLAGALSFLPGGLGGTEAVSIALLISAGVSESQAVAATILIRITTLWFAVVLGIVAMIAGRRHLATGVEAEPA